ncbi:MULTISPECIES: GNAT family N-acetyltransferase [unclassified Enterococcus]|uniref:GNAT family N-acetyltransferase n=1 Tax=unclassified Enterococcus TaxID=2608891 RepID=UPI0013ECE4F2|nr:MULTISPECIES: GNAT family N-acetyltransferase [unclassified Enterococcus]
MSEETSVILREAIPDDSQALLSMMRQAGKETDFLVVDEEGLLLSPEHLAIELGYLYESENNLLLVAVEGTKIIGVASIKAESRFRVSHIGEVGISILKEYWGLGLGTMLLEETIYWAEKSGVLFRLELDVQVRNERAIHLYRKAGFEIEARMARGVRTDEGVFLDVYKMSRLIG